MTSVFAVIVTYNRPDLLLRTIDAALNQSRPLDRIIVVDNASDTPASDIVAPHPLVQIERLGTNTGGSGGFAYGMRMALSEGADWVWVMDDDVSPRADCLQQLLSMSNLSECLHPKKLSLSGSEDSWEQLFNFKWSTPFKLEGNPSFKNGKALTFTNVACVEGMLASRNIISKVNFDFEEYFITHDDVLFGGIASLYTNVAFVNSAVIDKLLPSGRASGWKLYYYMRNSFWVVFDYYNRLGARPALIERLGLVLLKLLLLVAVLPRGWASVIPGLKGYFKGAATVLRWERLR